MNTLEEIRRARHEYDETRRTVLNPRLAQSLRESIERERRERLTPHERQIEDWQSELDDLQPGLPWATHEMFHAEPTPKV